jgi:hypothetical protein
LVVTTLTVEAADSVAVLESGALFEPLSTSCLTVTVRRPLVGATSLLLYCTPLMRVCVSAVDSAAPLIVTVAVVPDNVTV